MSKRKVTENILNYIKSEIEETDYGKVIIELSDNSNKIDVITEKRQRFTKEKIVHEPNKRLLRTDS